MQPNTLCEQVDAAMAEVLAGEASSVLVEHLAECERCRDARFDAEQAVEVVTQAASDYVHPARFEDDVLATLDAANVESITEAEDPEPDVPAPETARADPSTRTDSAESVDSDDSAKQTDDSAKQTDDSAKQTDDSAKQTSATPPDNVVPLRRIIPVLAAAVAAAGALLYWGNSSDGPRGTTLSSAEAWSGTVEKVARDFGSKQGLQLCESLAEDAPCSALKPGDRVAAPGVVKTDGLSRARLQMADGTELTLDRATSFALRLDGERRGRLEQGNIVADVKKQPGKIAIVDLPQGRAEVLGTKFGLRATGQLARVDVSRGQVRLVDGEGREVSVGAGEGGQLSRDRAPSAAANVELGSELAWSDTAFAIEGEQDVSTRGLGELRAQKPGEKDERKGAVTLTRHVVKVRIVENQARTEIEEVFTNHTDDVLEGIFRFPLPPDAQIERLALEVDGKLIDGAFVDRERAGKIWRGAIVNAQRKQPVVQDEIIWVPGPWKDPALLEWQRGGRFELRIFPIPKRGSRRIVLAYTQSLQPSGDLRRYTYPLAHDPSGTTRVEDFEIDVQVRGHDANFGVVPMGYRLNTLNGDAEVARLLFRQVQFTPSGDLTLEYRLPSSKAELRAWAYQPSAEDIERARAQQQRRSEQPVATRPAVVTDAVTDSLTDTLGSSERAAPYVALQLKPELPRWTSDAARAFVIVVDRSRSMYGEQYRRATLLASKIVEEMDRHDRVTAIACDTTCNEAWSSFQQPGPEAAAQLRAHLEQQVPEGASDVSHAIAEAAERAQRSDEQTRGSGERALRIIYIGDGTPTVGPTDPAFIRREIASVVGPSTSVSAITVGSDNDLTALSAVTQAGGGVLIPYSPGQTIAEAAYSALAATYGNALRDVQVTLPPGLSEVAPARLGTIAAGQEATVVARANSSAISGEVVLRGKLGDQDFEQRYPLELTASSAKGNTFVVRLFAAEHIKELEQRSDAAAREHAVALSSRFNVASRHTSLLVLESPAMFKAFGLDNTRAAPLWTGEESARGSEGGALADQEAEPSLESIGTIGSGGFGRSAGAPASKPKSAPAPAKRSSRNAPGLRWDDDVLELEPREEKDERWSPPPPVPPRQRMIPMRRIWERTGTVNVPGELPKEATVEAISRASAAVDQNPLSRDALKTLYVAYLRGGNIAQASAVAERWSKKDPMDADAMTARADIAAQRGERDLAIRILGSVVDIRPGDHKAQWRLARLHRWAGRATVGCRHSTAVAQLRRSDAALMTEAVRCARDEGQTALQSELLESLEAAVRTQVEQTLRLPTPALDALKGDFQLQANWDGARDDLDLVLVHPDGYRVSWLGAPTRAIITATDVLAASREGLALHGAQNGVYAVEIVRASPPAGPVHGTLELRIGKKTERIPFLLQGNRLRLATVNVQMRSRLVPL